MGFRIVVDTREQTPWTFSKEKKRLDTVRKMLKVGDYSVEGLEDSITIERKSLNDMFGTYSNIEKQRRAGRPSSFLQRLQEMRVYRYKVIVIECNATAFMKGPRYYHSTKLPARKYAEMINTFLINTWIAHEIPFIFLPRGLAQKFALKWLEGAYKKLRRDN